MWGTALAVFSSSLAALVVGVAGLLAAGRLLPAPQAIGLGAFVLAGMGCVTVPPHTPRPGVGGWASTAPFGSVAAAPLAPVSLYRVVGALAVGGSYSGGASLTGDERVVHLGACLPVGLRGFALRLAAQHPSLGNGRWPSVSTQVVAHAAASRVLQTV